MERRKHPCCLCCRSIVLVAVAIEEVSPQIISVLIVAIDKVYKSMLYPSWLYPMKSSLCLENVSMFKFAHYTINFL